MDSFPLHTPWNDRSSLLDGQFCFLNETADIGWPPDWSPDRSSLWRFNLHYHQFLPVLGDEEQRLLCRDWVEENPAGSRPAWHPYPLSRRIVTWARLGIRDSELLESLWKQASYLSRTVEWHQPGNHLLENGRALVLAGAFFGRDGRAGDWLGKGLSVLRRELPRQVLDDGGHMERSPMYHALVLEGVADILRAHRVSGSELLSEEDRRRFVTIADRMVDFLRATTHPDGGLALFNDTALEVAPPSADVIAHAGGEDSDAPRKHAFPESGFFVHDDGAAYLIVNGGPIGPDHLPGHGHADMFSYEFSLGGNRIIVDTGVHDYQTGGLREYARSTRAHNTVTVDGVDQAECWDSFRVGRRYPPEDVDFTWDETVSAFSGTFSGYRALIGDEITHRRHVRIDSESESLEVRDSVSGEGNHRVESRVHLHPEVRAMRRGGREIDLNRDGVQLRVTCPTHPIRTEASEYFPEFGRAEERTTLVIEELAELPTEIRYRVDYGRS